MRFSILCAVFIAATAFDARAELLAGSASVDITPPIGGRMYGYGARGTDVSEGVHDSLYAKALVLENGEGRLAIVALDWGTVTAENSKRIRRLVK